MAKVARVFAAVALLEEASTQFGRAEALHALIKETGTTEEKGRITVELSTWRDRLNNRRNQLMQLLREDYS